jgi:hypothetical protein
MSTPFSELKNTSGRKASEKIGARRALLRAGFLFGLFFNPEDGGLTSTGLHNIMSQKTELREPGKLGCGIRSSDFVGSTLGAPEQGV